MADQKVLIIDANLACEKCYKKLQKVLCKLQEKENIKTISFDTKTNTVTISGPFDAVRLERKLRCKAREAIKCIKPEAEKKPEKKPEKPDEKPEKKPEKPDEKPEKKPEKKPDEKPKDGSKEAAAPPPPSSTTVNLQFTQICNLCYPWPCSDPNHWGGFHQNPQPCEGMPPPVFPGHHQQCPPCAPVTPKRPCGGPSYCRGCGSCGGGGVQGWPPVMPTPIQMMQPPPMCSTGPGSCRGCKGCRIVQEGRFIYEEYPPSSCAVM